MWMFRRESEMDLEAAADEALLGPIARGDEAAFLTLYRRRQGNVYRYALHWGGDAEMAAEAVQETFLALLREAGNLRPERGTVLSWLLAVTRNRMLKLARERRHLSLDEEGMDAPAPGCVASEVEWEQMTGRLREAVASLPPAYREALVLCDMEELTYEEAAGIAGCPVGTVRSRLHRARALLAQKLKPMVGNPA